MRHSYGTAAIAFLAGLGPAQKPQQASTPSYWIKQLELPGRHEVAAERLVGFGTKAAAGLAGCLADPRPQIRLRAVRALGFLGEAGEPALAALLALDSGKDANESLAIASAVDAIRGGRGLLLVADFQGGKLLKLDGLGNERLICDGLPQLRSARRLASGNYLVAMKEGVREITPAGATVWSVSHAIPSDAVRIDNNRTLIAAADSHRVFEVDSTGKVTWSYTDEDREFRPVSCQRLRNGNTLIVNYPVEDLLAGSVIEIDRDKNVIWELPWKQPAMAQRLSGERTLLVSHVPGRVQIVNKKGKTLKLFQDVGIPSFAEYLPNGHLLVGGEGFVRELDGNGKRLWNKSVPWVVHIQRH
ncbi:MAG: PQQ-binding-like beta-propeller repeat protein [Planctomycetota bacterium]